MAACSPSGSTRAPAAPTTSGTGAGSSTPVTPPSATSPTSPPAPSTTVSAGPADIAARATVPVLCYHQLRDWTSKDGEYARNLLICPPANFRTHLDALAEGGWSTITPDQYLQHLTTGSPLPAQPVMLTFDDGSEGQVTEGLVQLQRRQMNGTFFVMTVVLDKPNWMSSKNVRALADAGMTVGDHTWDHHRVDRYGAGDWEVQLEQSRQTLQQASGEPVEHFAYPYGAWNVEAIPHLQAAGYKTAYQLSDKPLDPSQPLYTLRRTLVRSTWSGPQLLAHLAGGTA
ncbi:MAG: polysaccharide deacetylase family protein [Actinomycetes bacterium]